jgi:hypothetical protein
MRQQAIIGAVVFTVALAENAWAQGRPGTPAPLPAPPLPPIVDFKVDMFAVEPFEMGEPVEGAPYSADIVSEVTQDLADGNRIERRTTGAVARDSHGRVRREHQLSPIGPVVPEANARMVTISDPVADVHYSLDPVRKVAMRSPSPRVSGPIKGAVGTMISSDPAGHEFALEVRSEAEPPDVTTEQLGTKEIEGVQAEGTRTTTTLPAWAIGNVRPIQIVSERWYSPELHVVVFSRRADPRFGETIYRLTNITRTEPDPSLFQVPADYRHEDVKPFPFKPLTGR